MADPTAFSLKVMDIVRKIPRGRVATYKQVAGLSGKPGASRAVVWILNSCSKKYSLPWQRVIRAEGRIAFKPLTHNFTMQKRLLTKEGVEVQKSGEIDLRKYQWKKKPRERRPRNQPRMFSGS